MTLELPQLAGSDALTHSRMACYLACPRKHWYRYELGLRPTREATPLRFGSAYHLGLDVLKATGDLSAACQRVRDNYADVPEWAASDPAAFDDWLVECETVVRLVCGWHWRWSESPFEYVATEQVFEYHLNNHHKIAGKIDGVIRLPDSRLAIIEHKTASGDLAPDSDYWRKLRIDSQISIYMLAARKLGYDVQTVIYDVVRKPGIRPRKLTKAEQTAFAALGDWFCERFAPAVVERETPTMYGARLSSEIGADPDRYYARREIPRLESDLEQQIDDIRFIASNINASRRQNSWYRNTASCAPVGMSRCEYFPICSDNIDVSHGIPVGYSRVDNIHPELVEQE